MPCKKKGILTGELSLERLNLGVGVIPGSPEIELDLWLRPGWADCDDISFRIEELEDIQIMVVDILVLVLIMDIKDILEVDMDAIILMIVVQFSKNEI